MVVTTSRPHVVEQDDPRMSDRGDRRVELTASGTALTLHLPHGTQSQDNPTGSHSQLQAQPHIKEGHTEPERFRLARVTQPVRRGGGTGIQVCLTPRAC